MEQNKNIQVVCRVRPLNQKQIKEDSADAFQMQVGRLRIKDKDYHSVTPDSGYFSFDQVFQAKSTQQEFYESVGKPLVNQILNGLNVTLLAYGQTSSGKTFTMQGYGKNIGTVPRLISQIFKRIEVSPPHIQYRMKVSVIQIYMQKVKDLLRPDGSDLKIRQSKTLGIFIQNVSEVYVSQAAQVLQLLKKADCNRSVSATLMNDTSSRSHLVLTFNLHQNDLQDLSAKSSKVHLVDLAGSQKIAKTGAQGKLLDQAKGINKSLSALGNVINSLTEGKSSHIPYRDSKLTRILQQSLGGNSKTVLVITLSPAQSNIAQSLSTLRFGIRAKKIKNKPIVNRQYTVQQLLILLEKAESTIKQQAKTIRDLQSRKQGRLSKSKVMLNLNEQPSSGAINEQISQLKQGSICIMDILNDLEQQNNNQQQKQQIEENLQQKAQKKTVQSLEQELSRAYNLLQIERLKKEDFINRVNQLLGELQYKTLSILNLQKDLILKRNQVQSLSIQLQEQRSKVNVLQDFKRELQTVKESASIVTKHNKEMLRQQQLQIQIKSLKDKLESYDIMLQQKDVTLRKSTLFIQQDLSQNLVLIRAQNQQLRIQLKLSQARDAKAKQFLEQKQIFEQNLKNRCDKVMALSQQLEEEKQRNRYLMKLISRDFKPAQKILRLQQALSQTHQKYLSLKTRQCLWKNNEEMEKKRLLTKDSRIKELQQKLIMSRLNAQNQSSTLSVVRQKEASPTQRKPKFVKVFSSARFSALQLISQNN